MIETSVNHKSSRKLSIYAYFEQLQFEWICADLREKIYQHERDKQHWAIVKEAKRCKIENIATKNHSLPTIFDDEEMRITFNKKVYHEYGLPNFLYRDENQRKTLEFYDRLWYFHKGTDILVEIAGEPVVCKVDIYTPGNDSMKVINTQSQQQIEIALNMCRRIL